MFDVGFFELVVVFVIGLMILGPERLPKVVRSIGHWSGRARATLNNLKYEFEREAHNEEMKERFKQQLQELGLDEDMRQIEQAEKTLSEEKNVLEQSTDSKANPSIDQPQDKTP
ncbi:MAG: twin-arginine translocase subunit TatB [Gammaproteobacteria bacterium HGW-Gammaproteobacteria-14]|nr:MAG: twin-arginine translocase subunit TatB [Gammaproteobacteria bacterium HGW-Gammaproteobacteria-14]